MVTYRIVTLLRVFHSDPEGRPIKAVRGVLRVLSPLAERGRVGNATGNTHTYIFGVDKDVTFEA